MSKVVQYLKEIRLNDKDRLESYIWQSETEDLFILVDYLRTLIEEDYIIKLYNPFTFVPNDDLSGAGGCSELGCKIRRATKFAIFSTMYADDVYIQLSLITDQHYDFDIEEIDSNDELWFDFRYTLQCDISIINTYSMLIEAGILHIVPPRKVYCKNCFQKSILGLEHDISIEPIKKSLKEKVELVINDYDKDSNIITLRVNNMDEFFPEHTELFPIKKNEFIPMAETLIKPGKIIRDKEFTNNFIDRFVDSEFLSSCYYASYCKNNNAKFITNKLSDSMFMELTYKRNNSKDMISSYKNLPKYDLPFVQQITIEKALNLRQVEGESFNKYRIALNKAISEQCKTNSTIEWIQIYDDILYPAFNELDIKLKNINNGFYKKTFANIVLVGSIVTAGIYTGMVPNDINGIIESVGGVSTGVASLNAVVDKVINNKDTLKESDYYFLWRLKKDLNK